MLYTTCKYAPEELFSGFGIKTHRLDPNPVSFSCADGCAHPNLCGFAKAVIEEVSARGIRELIFTDCCDAMRRTYDVLLKEKLDFLYFLPLPHRSGEAEIRLFASQLKKLTASYEDYSGKSFSEEAAREACRRSIQEYMQQAEARRKDHGCISVLGAHGGSMLLKNVREHFPDLNVYDDTCSGNRFFTGLDEVNAVGDEDFFLWYAGLLLKGLTPCLRMYETPRRPSELEEFRPAKGIIYHTVKFCDYYSFEYAGFKHSAAVPLLKIETDTTPQSSGQLKTRIEAFAETLGVKHMKMSTKKPGEAAYIAGIDSGSTSTDVVIMDAKKQILGTVIIPTGMSASKSAAKALELSLKMAGLDRKDLDGIVATGYGRDILEMEKQTITEITCHAKGAQFLFPGARTIIDIGGQDSKVIRIDEEGNVLGFIMNDKCAAGTGRFLEMQARALGLSLEEMSKMGLTWKQEIQISNMCTVFAESEVVSLVAKDTPISDIIHGLNQSVAAKTISLIRRGKGEPGYAMTGGVSQNEGVVKCLEMQLASPVQVSERSQLCGAIGAALLGHQFLLRKNT